MAKLLDFEGKLWALMSSKDKAGRIYIRAYRNRWDSVKKRSFVESKVQVGRLLDDGSIRLSKNFVDKFPQYAHQTVFWGDHELLSEKASLKLLYRSRNRPTSPGAVTPCASVCRMPPGSLAKIPAFTKIFEVCLANKPHEFCSLSAFISWTAAGQ